MASCSIYKPEWFITFINKGFITTLDGGFTALLGGAINNEGTINANLGKVGIGVGQEIILDLSGDKFLQVSVPIDEAITVFDENEEEVTGRKELCTGAQKLLDATTGEAGVFNEESYRLLSNILMKIHQM